MQGEVLPARLAQVFSYFQTFLSIVNILLFEQNSRAVRIETFVYS